MTKLGPSKEEIERLRPSAPDGPIMVVNLLKFRPGEEGRQAYARYLAGAAGATHPDCRLVHAGPAFHDFGAGESWDYVIIAHYPRFDDFAWSVSQDAWQVDGARHRPDALEKTLMIVTPAGDLRRDFPV
jgi:hypothetical protein